MNASDMNHWNKGNADANPSAMNASERMRLTFLGQATDRVPFVPTVYEHGAVLIGTTPSKAAHDARLMAEAQIEAYRQYSHDYLVVGMDIYCIEAETLGCAIRFPDTVETPSVVGHPLADAPERLAGLSLPDPLKAGRMPLILEAASRVREQVGTGIDIGIAMVGPFTLATFLRGYENLMMDLIDEPEYCEELFDFTCRVCEAFGAAAARAGFQAALNESWIAQPLMSPDMYRESVFPLHSRVLSAIRAAGAGNASIVSGGDTTRIAATLYEAGSTIVMADGGLDLNPYMAACRRHKAALRACVPSALVEQGTPAEIEAAARSILARFPDRANLILGCGIVSPHTNPEHVRLLGRIARETGSR